MTRKLSRKVFLQTVVALCGVVIAGPAASAAPAEPAAPSEPNAAQEGCGDEGLMVQMKVSGTSRIAKMESELEVGPGLFDGKVCGNVTENGTIEGKLDLPPADGYFVAFRFMPVTNTTDFIQDGISRGKVTVDLQNETADIDTTVQVFIKVSDVRQDGVPLNAGGKCRTGKSAVIPLKGRVNLKPGSVSTIKSTYTIPPFSGCGSGEDLDPLLTGLVSGPGNVQTTRLTSCGIGTPCAGEGN